jgi:hypothetical protein
MGGGGVRQDEEPGTPPPGLVVKGKRSKRQRVHAPPAVLAAAAGWSSSSDSAGTSPSVDEAASAGTGGRVTEEEEDMALCLMMLSRGEPATVSGGVVNKDGSEVAVKEAPRFRSRRPAAGNGEFVYECRTCNKCFPSFQALGGHRTSHKKPRLIPPSSDDKSDPAAVDSVPLSQETPDAKAVAIPSVPVAPKQESGAAAVSTATSTSRHPRVHECSICGAEFASGQALGGHMRRHRPLAPATTTSRGDDDAAPAPRTKEKSLLELDLNLPAPCDEGAVTSPRFGFTVAERQPAAGVAMLFPAALVDCHY